MKTLIQIKALLGMLALAALIPAAADAQLRDSGGDTSVNTLDASLISNVDSIVAHASLLNSVDASVTQGELESLASVRQMNGQVQLLVELSTAASLADRVDLSASLLSTSLNLELVAGDDPNRLRVWASTDDLAGLVTTVHALDANIEVQAYRAPTANFGDVESEGTGAMLADLYHNSGARGAGVKIALFDIGYQGLADLQHELKVDQSFPHIAGHENDTSPHGTAMLEVLRDGAPDATLLPYRIDESLDVYTATVDALDRGAQIIVSPLSWFELPGEGAAADAATLATTNGVYWVNAAGNFSDGNYWEGFAPLWASMGDPYISFVEGEVIPHQQLQNVQVGDVMTVHFAYEVPRGSTLELSLELHSWDGVAPATTLVTAATPGMQHQVVSAVANDLAYYAMVRVHVADSQGRMRMFLPDTSHKLQHSMVEGAIANPATLDTVISVAAVPASAYQGTREVEAQSSRGGGLWGLDVDVAAPSMLATASYGRTSFAGTSAASASFSGLLALQLGDAGLRNDPMGYLHYVPESAQETGAGIVFAFVDAAEPDNDRDHASALGSSSVLVAGRSISPSTDIDYYMIEVLSNQSLEIAIDAPAALHLIPESNDGEVVTSDSGSLYDALVEPGIYYIAVEGTGREIAPSYTMNVSLFVGGPSAVELISPSDGEVVQPGAEMSWTKSESVMDVIYQVEIALDAKFSDIVASPRNSVTAIKMPELKDGAYYWRVAAVNGDGDQSDYSTTGKFELATKTEDPGNEDGVIGDPVSTETQSGDDDDEEFLGCTSSNSGSGIIFLMLAILGGLAGIRVRHARNAQGVKA